MLSVYDLRVYQEKGGAAGGRPPLFLAYPLLIYVSYIFSVNYSSRARFLILRYLFTYLLICLFTYLLIYLYPHHVPTMFP